MRILHVTRELAADRRFGIGRSLLPVLDALRSAGHEVHYLTQEQLGPRARAVQQRWERRLKPLARGLFGTPGEAIVGVWLERLNMGRLAAHVAARSGTDIVHLHDPWIAWGFRFGRLLYRARSRWGLTEHGFGSYTDAIRQEGVAYTPALLRWNRRLEARVLRAAGWVVCPTHAAREQLARDLALPAVPRHWHAVPHARPTLEPIDRAPARRQLGWPDDAWHVLAIGRINPVKRLELIVEACLALERPLTLTLLAEGDAGPLQRLVDGRPGARVELRVHPVDDVAPYLAAADAYVSTSLNESFGIANLEALCMGTPAVCTAVGGVPEVTGGAAWLIPPAAADSVRALTAALASLRDDPGECRRWAEAGRRHAANWPDVAAVGRRYEAIYQGLV